MSLPTVTSTASVRQHPLLAALFKACENRQPTPEELDEYARVLPAQAARAAAAREIAQAEAATVEQVVNDILAVYPFERNLAYARVKCIRDVTSVSSYATLAMLMNDPAWFRDKLLLWLRTLLQALNFPDREQPRRKTLFGKADTLDTQPFKPHLRAIFETYSRLRIGYQERLSPEAFAFVEPFLQQAVDTLAGD